MRLQLDRDAWTALHVAIRRLLAGVLGLCVVGSAATLRADEASGTWTGDLEARGNYFLERSTRVMVPTGKVRLAAPSGTHFDASYLVDVISSASVAQTGGGKDGVYTELRHAVAAGAGQRFTVHEAELDLRLHARYSTENDYKSLIFGLDGTLALNEKNTTLSLGLSRMNDHWEPTVSPNAGGSSPLGGSSARPTLDGLTARAGISQLLSPVVVLSGGYQLGFMEGFLGNPYRRALIGPLPHLEDHPHERIRHNFDAHLAWFISQTATSLHLLYRAYIDSWDIVALTPEARVYQELGQDVVLRARYRYYAQNRAYFYESPRYPRGYVGPVSNDPKMSEFDSHQLGLKLELRISGLRGTVLDFAKQAWFDLSFDRQFCTSSFGNNVMATAGVRLPF